MMTVSPWTDGKYQKYTKGIWAHLPQHQNPAGRTDVCASNIKTNLKEIQQDSTDWIELPQSMGPALVSHEHSKVLSRNTNKMQLCNRIYYSKVY